MKFNQVVPHGVLICIYASIALVACSKTTTDLPPIQQPAATQAAPPPVAPVPVATVAPEPEPEPPKKNESEEHLKMKVLATLKDPDSAKFQNLRLMSFGDALCGEINAKNSYGGYTGYKAFVVDAEAVAWAGDGSAAVDIGNPDARNSYVPKAHKWGCI